MKVKMLVKHLSAIAKTKGALARMWGNPNLATSTTLQGVVTDWLEVGGGDFGLAQLAKATAELQTELGTEVWLQFRA